MEGGWKYEGTTAWQYVLLSGDGVIPGEAAPCPDPSPVQGDLYA